MAGINEQTKGTGLQRGASAPLGPYMTDLAMWLKAETVAQADGSTVTDWTDSSVNNKGMTAHESHGPIYKTSGQNSQSYLNFSGSLYMRRDNDCDHLTAAGANTIFMVCTLPKPGSTQFILDGNPDNGIARRYAIVAAGGLTVARDGGGGSVATNDYNDGDHKMVSWVINGASSSLSLNGVEKNTGTISADATEWASLFLGTNRDLASGRFIGRMYEFLVYSGAIPLAGISQTNTYLLNKFALS